MACIRVRESDYNTTRVWKAGIHVYTTHVYSTHSSLAMANWLAILKKVTSALPELYALPPGQALTREDALRTLDRFAKEGLLDACRSFQLHIADRRKSTFVGLGA
jgi:hypothetical protein